jgi:hypothetical protein
MSTLETLIAMRDALNVAIDALQQSQEPKKTEADADEVPYVMTMWGNKKGGIRLDK